MSNYEFKIIKMAGGLNWSFKKDEHFILTPSSSNGSQTASWGQEEYRY